MEEDVEEGTTRKGDAEEADKDADTQGDAIDVEECTMARGGRTTSRKRTMTWRAQRIAVRRRERGRLKVRGRQRSRVRVKEIRE